MKPHTLAAAVILAALAAGVRANPPTAPASQPAAPDQARWQATIKQLGADDFAARDAAQKDLDQMTWRQLDFLARPPPRPAIRKSRPGSPRVWRRSRKTWPSIRRPFAGTQGRHHHRRRGRRLLQSPGHQAGRLAASWQRRQQPLHPRRAKIHPSGKSSCSFPSSTA